eukprot:GHVS01092084.1.p1 GENE.GHVS01092084.1~~GHVS01092084.1.p1  ORF type:complete len:346 (-),score=65.53 GHVS01092084.1:388-1425(-)
MTSSSRLLNVTICATRMCSVSYYSSFTSSSTRSYLTHQLYYLCSSSSSSGKSHTTQPTDKQTTQHVFHNSCPSDRQHVTICSSTSLPSLPVTTTHHSSGLPTNRKKVKPLLQQFPSESCYQVNKQFMPTATLCCRRYTSAQSGGGLASTPPTTTTCGGNGGGCGSYWASQGAESFVATVSDDKIIELKERFDNLKDYSLEDLRSWLEAFDSFDHDSDGFISHADLQKNTQVTLDKIRILKQYDADQNNLIDFGEFVHAMYEVDVKALRDNFDGFDQVDIQLEFDKFSTNQCGVHVISLARVKDLMSERNFTSANDRDAYRLFTSMDVNNDGLITVNDFAEWVKMR